jgi:hypothetical protein
MDDSYENADYPIAGYNFIKLLNTNDPSMFICIWLANKKVLKNLFLFFFTHLNVNMTTMLHGKYPFFFFFLHA